MKYDLDLPKYPLPMIALDSRKFMEDSYLILRGLVPPDMLGPLQDTSEELVRRKWPEGMPQGAFANWIHGFGNNIIDEQTANTASTKCRPTTKSIDSALALL